MDIQKFIRCLSLEEYNELHQFIINREYQNFRGKTSIGNFRHKMEEYMSTRLVNGLAKMNQHLQIEDIDEKFFLKERHCGHKCWQEFDNLRSALIQTKGKVK